MTTSKRSLIATLLLVASSALAADPWADAVVSYDAGFAPGTTDPLTSFIDPTTALGEPTRITSPASPFGGPVTPLNGAFGEDELVSIGEIGSLTVRFDQPVTDDPRNPFGVDLIVFGNAFFFGSSFPVDENTTATGLFAEPAAISVSADGVNFVSVPNVFADDLYPTAGFVDFDSTAPSDFTRPVDPQIDLNDLLNLTTPEILARYGGSGGGAGVDIGALGLSEISYVRVTNPPAAGFTTEIDGFADVRAIPEPATAGLLATALLLGRRRARR